MLEQTVKYSCDVLVLGGGGTGARAALSAAEEGAKVILACKGVVSRSGSTAMAYPAINAALNNENDGDTIEKHYRDLVEGGRGLADEDLALALAQDMPARIKELELIGTQFERDEGGRLLQIQHPGHNCARTLTIKNGGSGMITALRREIQKHPEITVLEDTLITDLAVEKGHVCGAVGMDKRTGNGLIISAKAVIVATGGYEAMWQHTDVSPDVTGDGLVLAYNAGADLIDLEMILYYPFVGCGTKGRGIMLQYESLVHPDRFGGRMIDAAGNDLLKGAMPPPRDEMLRIMEEAVNAGNGGPNGGVFLDLSKSSLTEEKQEELIRRFFNFSPENLKLQGIDFNAGPVEVKPGLHYSLGGIRIHADCASSIPGLYAAGECSSNLHGSNRLSGNALAETQAFGYRSGKSAAAYAASCLDRPTSDGIFDLLLKQLSVKCFSLTKKKDVEISPFELKKALCSVMDEYVGSKRCENGLKTALSEIAKLQDRLNSMKIHSDECIFNNELCAAFEAENMIKLARLIAESALFRKETRGHHIRTDYPATETAAVHTLVRKSLRSPATCPVTKI